MTAAVAIAVAVSLLVAAGGPALGRRLPPATAARLLTAASVLVAGCSVFVAGVLAFTWVGQLAPIAALGEWSVSELRSADPIPIGVAAACATLLPPAAGWWLTVFVRRCRELVRMYGRCRHLRGAGVLVVVDDARPDAFTTPQPARIVVTTGLLRALTDGERRVVLAHEASHLVHRHAWWVLAADLAAAANPLLRPTAAAVARAAERWADEDAAASVGDRRAAARALARTALLTRNPDLAGRFGARTAPAATGGDVPGRVRALLAPPPRRRPASVAALSVLLAVLAAATVMVQHHGEELFEYAKHHRHTTATTTQPAPTPSTSRIGAHPSWPIRA